MARSNFIRINISRTRMKITSDVRRVSRERMIERMDELIGHKVDSKKAIEII